MSEEALQIAEKRRDATGKGEKERYKHLNAEFQRIARRDKIGYIAVYMWETGGITWYIEFASMVLCNFES